jgi:hypothetical protein
VPVSTTATADWGIKQKDLQDEKPGNESYNLLRKYSERERENIDPMRRHLQSGTG